jgi:hypothetical protein
MAIFAATDYKITFATTDWSDWITSVGLPITAAELDTTAFGDTWTTAIGGLKSFSMPVTFHQDFVDNGLDEVMFAAIGTVIPFTVAPTSSTVGTGNPEYQGSVLITSWDPVAATVGNLATVSVTWKGTGAITRDVTPG